MATLNQIIAEQAKLIGEAKKNLEAAQKKPPAVSAAIAAKESLLADLKERAAILTKAKAETIRGFDDQIATYRTEIVALEKEMEEDKKRLGDQPPPRSEPGSNPRRGGRNN